MIVERRVGVVGCGKMGGALAQSFVERGGLAGDRLHLYDKVPHVAKTLSIRIGGQIEASAVTLCERVDLLLIAVKPQDIPSLLSEIAVVAHLPQIVVSVAAGVTLSTFRAALGDGPSIIRTMPNRPVLVEAGITALMGDRRTRVEHVDEVAGLMRAAGETVRLEDEGLFDAVTALSASGPAFVDYFIEGMTAGGVATGLDAETAERLAVATVLGAAKLLDQMGTSPAEEREAVSSPGGTTLAGLAVLRDRDFLDAVAAAIEAAARRSRELGRGSS